MNNVVTRVAVLATKEGKSFILRANPTTEEVKGFIREQNRRVNAGIPAGPSGMPARHIVSAKYFEDESDALSGEPGTEIDISDVLEQE